MNNKAAKLMVAMMLVLGAAIPGWAQYSGAMKVTVPFDFVVENSPMHAGDYTIERASNGMLRIRGNDSGTTATFLAVPKQGNVTPEKAHFLFHRYGSDYFLATIWTPGQETGWEVLQGKLEMELARKSISPVVTAMVLGR